MTVKAERFSSTVLKKVKRLHIEEKESEKAYVNFKAMLEEAEISMNQGKPYEKDFWLAENQCLVSFKKQYDKQKEMADEIVEIWDKAEAMEEVRIRSIKVGDFDYSEA
jgi:dsDNA-binding SOS-regulon protein